MTDLQRTIEELGELDEQLAWFCLTTVHMKNGILAKPFGPVLDEVDTLSLFLCLNDRSAHLSSFSFSKALTASHDIEAKRIWSLTPDIYNITH